MTRKYQKRLLRAHSIDCLRAIEAFVGSREKLAKKIGCSKSCIDRWVRVNKVSPNYVVELSKVSGGRFSVEELLSSKG